MSNGHTLELGQRKMDDGKLLVSLIYWDSLHGNDRIYVVKPDGIYLVTEDSEGKEKLSLTNFPQALLNLHQDLTNQAQAATQRAMAQVKREVYQGTTHAEDLPRDSNKFSTYYDAQVSNIKRMVTKNNEVMAVVTIEFELEVHGTKVKPTATRTFVVFPKTWMLLRDILESMYEFREYGDFSLLRLDENTLMLDAILDDETHAELDDLPSQMGYNPDMEVDEEEANEENSGYTRAEMEGDFPNESDEWAWYKKDADLGDSDDSELDSYLGAHYDN